MISGLLLISALLPTSSGQFQLAGPPQKVQALAGQDVVLPCSFNVTRSPDPQTVEWSKDGPKPNIVFLLRNGCETHEEKIPAFEHRTSLFMKKLKEGNISLRISNVHLSDAGTYTCKTLWDNPPHEVTSLELVVATYPDSNIIIVVVVGVAMFLLGGLVAGVAVFLWTRSRKRKKSTTRQESKEGEEQPLWLMTEDETDMRTKPASAETQSSLADYSCRPEDKPRSPVQHKCSLPIQESYPPASTRVCLSRSFSDPQTFQPGPDPLKSERPHSSIFPSAFPTSTVT